jgi:hypothetical protein
MPSLVILSRQSEKIRVVRTNGNLLSVAQRDYSDDVGHLIAKGVDCVP